MFGGEPVNDDGSPIDENAGRVRPGPLRAAHRRPRPHPRRRQEWEVDGFGLRDHSWGPRYWQAPWWYRWLTANFGDDFGFMVSIIASRDGPRRSAGSCWDGEYTHIDDAEIDTEWEGDDLYHREIRATPATPDGDLRDRGQRCCRSSRCATAATTPTATCS